MNESRLVTDWARFQLRLGRTFPSPEVLLTCYCEETKTGMSVDTDEEMAAAMKDLKRQMMSETR